MKACTVFSDDRVYRYVLVRRWAPGIRSLHGILGFIMLNPSTADEVKNDPTVERCERRARGWGYNGLCVLNLFALRSTSPRSLYTHDDPVGPGNDAHIIERARACQLVVCGWGTHGALLGRGARVLELLRQNDIVPHALSINRDGSPQHPLYVSYDLIPVEMTT